MFRDKDNAEDFAFKPEETVAQSPDEGVVGERIITTPQTADWWISQQFSLPNPQEDVVAALIIFSDETLMAGSGRVKAHPVVISLANIALAKRWRPHGHRLVAFLPIVDSAYHFSSEQKVAVMHAALKKILSPLKDASFT
jgi:Plavaka transposase